MRAEKSAVLLGILGGGLAFPMMSLMEPGPEDHPENSGGDNIAKAYQEWVDGGNVVRSVEEILTALRKVVLNTETLSREHMTMAFGPILMARIPAIFEKLSGQLQNKGTRVVHNKYEPKVLFAGGGPESGGEGFKISLRDNGEWSVVVKGEKPPSPLEMYWYPVGRLSYQDSNRTEPLIIKAPDDPITDVDFHSRNPESPFVAGDLSNRFSKPFYRRFLEAGIRKFHGETPRTHFSWHIDAQPESTEKPEGEDAGSIRPREKGFYVVATTVILVLVMGTAAFFFASPHAQAMALTLFRHSWPAFGIIPLWASLPHDDPSRSSSVPEVRWHGIPGRLRGPLLRILSEYPSASYVLDTDKEPSIRRSPAGSVIIHMTQDTMVEEGLACSQLRELLVSLAQSEHVSHADPRVLVFYTPRMGESDFKAIEPRLDQFFQQDKDKSKAYTVVIDGNRLRCEYSWADQIRDIHFLANSTLRTRAAKWLATFKGEALGGWIRSLTFSWSAYADSIRKDQAYETKGFFAARAEYMARKQAEGYHIEPLLEGWTLDASLCHLHSQLLIKRAIEAKSQGLLDRYVHDMMAAIHARAIENQEKAKELYGVQMPLLLREGRTIILMRDQELVGEEALLSGEFPRKDVGSEDRQESDFDFLDGLVRMFQRGQFVNLNDQKNRVLQQAILWNLGPTWNTAIPYLIWQRQGLALIRTVPTDRIPELFTRLARAPDKSHDSLALLTLQWLRHMGIPELNDRLNEFAKVIDSRFWVSKMAPAGAQKIVTEATRARRSGDPQAAIDVLRHALDLFPEDAILLFTLALQYTLTKQFDKASGPISQAADLSPKDPWIRMLQAHISFYTGHVEQAIEQMSVYMGLGQHLPEGHQALRFFRAQASVKYVREGRLEDAIRELDWLRHRDQQNVPLHEILSAVYALTGNLKMSSEYHVMACELEPLNVMHYIRIIKDRQRAENLVGVHKWRAHAMKLFSQDPDLHLALADAYLYFKNEVSAQEEALHEANTAIGIAGTEARMYAMRAKVYLVRAQAGADVQNPYVERQNMKRAIADLETAFELDPTSIAAHAVEALVLTENETYGRAIEEVEWTIHQRPQDTETYTILQHIAESWECNVLSRWALQKAAEVARENIAVDILARVIKPIIRQAA